MGFILTVTAGLIVWIVLWALGAKGFDAFMLATVIILVGAIAEDPLRLPSGPSQLARPVRVALAVPGRSRRRRAALAGCGGVASRGPAKRPATSWPSTRACRCRDRLRRSRPANRRRRAARAFAGRRPRRSVQASATSRSTTPTRRRGKLEPGPRSTTPRPPRRTRARSPTSASSAPRRRPCRCR